VTLAIGRLSDSDAAGEARAGSSPSHWHDARLRALAITACQWHPAPPGTYWHGHHWHDHDGQPEEPRSPAAALPPRGPEHRAAASEQSRCPAGPGGFEQPPGCQ